MIVVMPIAGGQKYLYEKSKVMISPVSITGKYIVQPSLLNNHRRTLDWLSTAVLWKSELAFFQKLLDMRAPMIHTIEDKKTIDHFQNLITYYKYELIDSLCARLRLHEKKLAEMLENCDETMTAYFSEHEGIMAELEALNTQFIQYKGDLFTFMGKAI
jgi:hypothetical protein